MGHFETSAYHFDLPQELIADTPLETRDQSRLLVVNRRSKTLEHRTIRDLVSLLSSQHVLVANNTRVFRARLLGERLGTRGKVEFFLLSKSDSNTWQGMMKTGSKVLPGFQFRIPVSSGAVIEAEVISRSEGPEGALFTARFSSDPVNADAGEVPLPPYIVQKRASQGIGTVFKDELSVYNTVFSKESGSVAAPTAGRHFTLDLIEKLRSMGVSWEEITLHVGIGTFKPVSTDDVRDHAMHAETTAISPEVAVRLNDAKKAGKSIVAIGTTTARTLEGRALLGKDPHVLEPGVADVNLYIHPGSGHQWTWADAMLTNFHLPGSTLLMMVASRIGDLDFTLEAYRTAIRERYRFYSYGDAMLIMDR